MARKIRVPEKYLPAISRIVEYAEKLPVLSDLAAESGLANQIPDGLSGPFAAKAQIPTGSARDIVVQLLAFHDLRTGLGLSAAELFDAITGSLEQQIGQDWTVDDLQRWRAARPLIESTLEEGHPLGILQKSTRLTYAHQNVLFDVRIISDLRPTFDDSARVIHAMTIGHVMELEYHDGSQDRHFFIALDAVDIAKLKKACERAETKAATLVEQMKAFSWPTVVAGDHLDD